MIAEKCVQAAKNVMRLSKVPRFDSMIYLEKRSPFRLTILSVILVLLLGAIDVLTGFKLNFSLLYLVPVAMASWGISRRAGLFIAALSTLVLDLSNLAAGGTLAPPFVLAWNTLTQLLIFALMSLLLDALRYALEEERRYARTDPLTGVLNRRAFYEVVNSRILFARPVSPPFTLVYIDLDNFKPINDMFGHTTGDSALVTIAHTAANAIDPQDVFARLGGDEFILLTMETDPQALNGKVTHLQRELLAAMQAQEWPITFSIGVLTFRQPSGSVGQMITMTDRLMYQVKSSSKNAVAYAVFPDTPLAPPGYSA
jgi:diguanylate cyclase (GGDEF)-like protein